jgi:hypothetical protein
VFLYDVPWTVVAEIIGNSPNHVHDVQRGCAVRDAHFGHKMGLHLFVEQFEWRGGTLDRDAFDDDVVWLGTNAEAALVGNLHECPKRGLEVVRCIRRFAKEADHFGQEQGNSIRGSHGIERRYPDARGAATNR